MPRPFTQAAMYNRTINIEKLLAIKFAKVPEDLTLDEFKEKLEIPEEFTIEGVRPMEEKDLEAVTTML